MLRLENVPPEQMPEVVHIASELYEKDKERAAETQERQATVDAAKEVGLPEEYLHLAAEELHERRVRQAQRTKSRRKTMFVVGGIVTAVIAVSAITFTRDNALVAPATVATVQVSPAPPFVSTNWKLATNAGTQATVDYSTQSATIHVQRFAPDGAGHFTANLNNTDGAKNLSGFRSVSFNLHGTLPKVRLFLEHGNERWRSPSVDVQGQDQQVKLDLTQFEHQTREGATAQWQKSGYTAPEMVDDMSFKTGWFVNDAGASGDVTIGDVKFE